MSQSEKPFEQLTTGPVGPFYVDPVDLSGFIQSSKRVQPTTAHAGPFDIGHVLRVVMSLAPARFDDYAKAIAIGMALKNSFGDAAFDVFDIACRQSDKYLPSWPAEKWASFSADYAGDKLTFQSVEYWAAQDNATPLPEGNGKPLEPLSFHDFRDKHKSYERPVIIDGLLRAHDTMMLVGSTKSRKTFFMVQLILSVIGSIPLLGRYATSLLGSVLYLDYELFEDDIIKRVEQTQRALGVPDEALDKLEYVSMRGKESTRINEVCDWLDREPPGKYSLVVFDAIYRAYPVGFMENENADFTMLMNRLDATSRRHGNAFILVHHSSKGSQAKKSNTDIGAGAGAQSRASDCHLTLVEHSEGKVTMRASLRSFAPLEPVVLEFKYPVWSIDDNADPNLTTGLAHVGVQDVVALLKSEQGKEEFIKGASRMLKAQGFYAPLTDIRRVVELGIEDGQIVQTVGNRGKHNIAPVKHPGETKND